MLSINRCHRIVVLGTSGSGKSVLAARISALLDVPRIELDALNWGPAWLEVPRPVLRARVAEATAGSAWVADGNYGHLRDLLWAQADTLVWLDYSFALTFFRALRRTLRRIVRREVLWSGNLESWSRAFLSRDSILLWVLKTHARRRREYPVLLAAAALSGRHVVHCRTPAEAERFLAFLCSSEADVPSWAPVPGAAFKELSARTLIS